MQDLAYGLLGGQSTTASTEIDQAPLPDQGSQDAVDGPHPFRQTLLYFT